MTLTSADLNAFSQGLATRFAERAVGQDESSARLVAIRPVDHVLAGFLTPGGTGQPAESAGDPDQQLANDLPRDSAYEQSCVGIEWLVPRNAWQSRTEFRVSVHYNVFVRRLPDFDDQLEHGIWTTRSRSRQRDGREPVERSEVVQLWTRESLPEIEHVFCFGDLIEKRSLSRSLEEEVLQGWPAVSPDHLYPGRRPMDLLRENMASREAFDSWRSSLKHQLARTERPPVHWKPVIDIRSAPCPTEPGVVRVAVRLVNRTVPIAPVTADYADANLYSVALTVRTSVAAHRPALFRELPSSYRFDRTLPAIGINADVEAEQSGNDIVLQSRAICYHESSRLVPRTIEESEPTFAALSSSPDGVLQSILSEMKNYMGTAWKEKVNSLLGQEKKEAEQSASRFEDEIARFQRGVDLLSNPEYPAVRKAFLLLNRAMMRAAEHYASWRLFQIVFIVSQLPGLAAREYPELGEEGDEAVDILWFAAGGGKTEAFLGLILWQAFFDRIRGKRFGTAAFVRFPLRLLSFQQLGRFSQALAKAELLRDEEKLGGERFSLGFFVGRPVTPNRVDDDDHRRFRNSGVDARYQRVYVCPFCGADTVLRYEPTLRVVEHWCSSGACPGGSCRLPVFVVDQDVYRFMPTVIVSTVDKLAQMGQNQRFANLFGRVDLMCTQHGASFQNPSGQRCEAAKAFVNGEAPPTCGGTAVHYGPFHDLGPSLLVQDEMHLLSEELGAFDAHYETAALQLSRSLGRQEWKIIGATATIEEHEQHAWQLYLKRSRRFPGPGPEAEESFYYTRDDERIGRIFLGVLGVGRKHTPIVSRVLTLLYLEIEHARQLTGSDPTAAAGRYGLGSVDGQDLRHLVFLYELVLTYVLTRKGSDQVAEAIESRVKRELNEGSPGHGDLIVETFNSGVDVTEMIEAMKEIESDDPASDPSGRIRGLVTTNIIGHGVDVDRFNLIVFAGYTRLAAEYIQASARVGRTYPGLSVLVVTPQGERDRSILARFSKFHQYLDRLVDPSAVTRWSEPAFRRTVPGLICAYVMGVASAALRKSMATVEQVHRYYGRAGSDALNEDAVVEWVIKALGAEQAPSPRYLEQLDVFVRNQYSRIINTPVRSGEWRALNVHMNAMRSLRDVDDPAEIRVGESGQVMALRRLIGG